MNQSQSEPSCRSKFSTPGVRIAPSMLSADFSRLREHVALIENGGADLLHIDVMDGHFVPNISFGPCVIAALRPHCGLIFDAHLMISEPKRYAESFVKAGCDHITFHVEVTKDPADVIDHIHDLGASAGVCINPTTPVEPIEPIIGRVELVLVMSVWPGFSGQKFIPDVLPKVARLKTLLGEHQRLQIDGGVDPTTIADAVRAGADTMVAGSAVFGTDDPVAAMNDLRRLATQAAGETKP